MDLLAIKMDYFTFPPIININSFRFNNGKCDEHVPGRLLRVIFLKSGRLL